METKEKLNNLRAFIKKLNNAIIAYSGGIDSTLVARICRDELGEKAIAVTATSPSYPKYELEQAKKIAKKIGIEHLIIETHEIKNEQYLKNKSNRCYFCKTTLYSELEKIAKELNYENILNGINVDDLGDFRPGIKAAKEYRVISPLKEVGLTKKDIIEIAEHLGLPNWNKPASPCLSSRVPYGIMITPEILEKIEKAEDVLRDLGLMQFRVRYHKEIARIEVEKKDFEVVLANADLINKKFRDIGFAYTCLDLRGFKSGRLNEINGVFDEKQEKEIAL